MRIPLTQFEQLIDPVILKRGLTYFSKGLVNQVGEGTTGELSFIVHGTADYEIILEVKGGHIDDFTCDCPFTDGPVCKHIAAVIFYLTQDELDLNEASITPKPTPFKRGRPRAGRPNIQKDSHHDDPGKNPNEELLHVKQPAITSKRKSKKASLKTQVDDILKQLTTEELKDYFVNEVLSNKTNQADFLAFFASKNEHESVETYRTQVKAILSAAKGRYGFVDRGSASKVGKGVYAIAQSAHLHMETGNSRSAMLISMAVLEEMTKALDFVDDSNSDVGSNIEIALETLISLSQKPVSQDFKRQLFEYATEKFREGEFEGWDWQLGMIQIAANLAENDAEISSLISMLNIPDSSDFDRVQMERMHYSLLLKRKDKAEAQQFLEQHLHNSDLKKIALEQAFINNDFERVKKLAFTAIETDKTSKPGLLSDWYDWLIKVAMAEGDTEKIMEYAHLQLFHHGRESESYFQLIRQNTPASEWQTVYVKLLNEMAGARKWQLRALLPKVMVAEQDWNNLYTYLKMDAHQQGNYFDQLALYGQYLLTSHHAGIGELMKHCMLATAQYASSRREYNDMAKDLRQMKKMGFSEIVNSLVQDFKIKFKYRPAMMEEINKV